MKVKITGLEERELNPQKFGGMCSRATVELKRENKIDFEKGIDTVATTDAPTLVIDWDRWRIIREVLPMQYMEAPDDDDATLLDTHDRSSIKKIMGSAREWNKDEHNALAKLFISEAEPEVRQKIKEGHIKRVSIGYETDSDRTVEIPKGKDVVIDGITYKNEFKDEYPFVVRLWWKVKELSLVPIPADKAAKFRSEIDEIIKLMEKQNTEELVQLRSQLENHENTIKELNQKLTIRSSEMKEAKELTPEEIKKQERERVKGIEEIAKRFAKSYKPGADALKAKAEEAVKEDWSADQFRAHVFEQFDDSKPFEKMPTDLDMSKKERSKLSVSKALTAMIDLRGGDQTAWVKHKAEREQEAIMEASERASKAGLKLKGMALPWDFFMNDEARKHSNLLSRMQPQKRAGVDTTVAANLIPEEHWGSEFIDVLRNLGVAGPWGVRQITGVEGTLAVPKKTSTGTFHWVTERGTGTATDFVIGQVTATPKDGWSSMVYGRRALLLSNPALDGLVLDDILQTHIVGRDKALLHGAGTNEPTGIAITSGVGDVVGASLDHDAIVEFWTDVAVNNIDVDSMKFVMNPLTAGILMKRPVVSGGYQGFLMDNQRKVNGYGSIISNQANDGYLFYGDGSEAWIVNWGVIDVLVNPYKDDSGDVTITAFSSMDIIVARAGAFTLSDDVT